MSLLSRCRTPWALGLSPSRLRRGKPESESKVVKHCGGYTKHYKTKTKLPLNKLEPLPDGEACLEGWREAVKVR